MSGFEDREKTFEKRYAHEEKIGFDVEARCSKLYGLWVAQQLGLEGADAKTYAMELVNTNLEEPGFEDVLRRVRADFKDKGLSISEHVMKAELDKALEEAKRQIMTEKKK